MKISKTVTASLILLSSLVSLTSCEEYFGFVARSPSITYPETNLNATFFQTGSSAAPAVDWNGEQGRFSLITPIEGLTINSTNGVVSWSELLQPGTQDFQIIAANGASQITVDMSISNPLQGVFTGTYSETNFFEVEFFADGTVEVRADGEIATGTWEINEDEIVANYTYEDFDIEASIRGTLTQTSANATLEGNWYNGFEAVSGNERGTFNIVLN